MASGNTQHSPSVDSFLRTRLQILQFMLGGQLTLSEPLRELLNQQPVGVFLLSATGDSVFTNQYALDLVSVPRADGTAMWSERLEYANEQGEPIDVQQLPSVRALSGAPAEVATIRVRNPQSDASVRIHAVSEAIRDDAGTVLGSASISIAASDLGRDFSWGSRLAVSALVDQAPYPLAIVDDQMRYVAHSHAWLQQHEISAQTIVGRAHDEVFCDPDPAWPTIRDEALAGTPHHEQARRIIDAAGHVRYVYQQVVPWRTQLGGIGGLVLHRRDVTERVEAIDALERMNRRLSATNDALEQFAYAASHDLREPLRVVGQYAQLLARRYGDTIDERGQRYLRYLVEGTERMSEMVSGLLAYAVAEPSDLTQPVALDAVLAEVVASVRGATEAAEATFVLPTSGVMLEGDAALYASVFRNLVMNALKYRSPDRAPRVEFVVVVAQNAAEVTVTDNGRGFTAEQQERMFRLFQRLDNVGDVEGTGLGLALVRRQLAVMGGTITAEGSVGVGARFTLTAPRAQ